MAADAERLADRLIETEGDETVEALDLRGLLKGLAPEGFPSKEVSARMAGEGFVMTLRAVLVTERPRRRVILATALKAEARAIGELIVDTQDTEALAWRAMTGEA
jgi:hypothetical protein